MVTTVMTVVVDIEKKDVDGAMTSMRAGCTTGHLAAMVEEGTVWYTLLNVICLPTEHQRALGARFKGDRAFQVELKFRNVGF